MEEKPRIFAAMAGQNEMIANFLKPGLEDLAVSPVPPLDGGVPVDFDPKHIVCVWIDASTMVTAMGYGSDNDADYKKYWPADVVEFKLRNQMRFHYYHLASAMH